MLNRFRIFIIFSFIIFVSCKNTNKVNIFSEIGINGLLWKNDSLGCMNYRSKSIELILERKEFLEKKGTMLEVLNYLGKPNYVNSMQNGDIVFIYLIDKSKYCIDRSLLENKIMLETRTLYFQISNKKLIKKIGQTIP